MRRRWSKIGLIALVVGGTMGGIIWQNMHKTEYEKLVERSKQGEIPGDLHDDPGLALIQRNLAKNQSTSTLSSSEALDLISRTMLELNAEFPQTTVRRANEGAPQASLEYGYHLVARAAVADEVPHDAIPFLMTAAMHGNIGAHVQLALIETVTKDDGDLIRAWAHFDIALRDMPKDAPDFRSSEIYMSGIEAGLTDAELGVAKALSQEYRDTMRANRNALK